MATITVIYKHINHGATGTTFRCEKCEVHFICGICPRFCPLCGVQFNKWQDASIDKLIEPDRKWDKDSITPIPYEGAGFCGLASPPSAEEIEYLSAERERGHD